MIPDSPATSPATGRQVSATLGYFDKLLGALQLGVTKGPIDSEGNFTEKPADVGFWSLLYGFVTPGWWGLVWDNQNSSSPLQFSTSEAEGGAGQLWCELGIYLGLPMVHITATGSSDTAPPARPGSKAGDIEFNTDPQAGGHVGWVWVVPAGSTGAWKQFGRIES